MDFSKKLLMETRRFPANGNPPTSYTATRVATSPSGGYLVYTVQEDGWYRVNVCGAGGGNSVAGSRGAAGGARSQIVYLYQGETCLLWAGVVGTGKAYPGEATYEFGGRGGYGHDESGAGGGAPAATGTGNPHWEGGLPGQGSGFIAGFQDTVIDVFDIVAGAMTRNINYTFNATVCQFKSITTYVLCGGGGGGCSDNGDNRTQGGGGGAFGNGGNALNWIQEYATGGPAGSSWGVGAGGRRYGGGGEGAWAVVDFSRNVATWGQGGGSGATAGYCNLDKIVQS